MGVIAFRQAESGIQYLMICRKDSLGYVDFVRGKYPLHDKKYLTNIFSEMTLDEKHSLLTKDFSGLEVVISLKSGLEANLEAGVVGFNCLVAIINFTH